MVNREIDVAAFGKSLQKKYIAAIPELTGRHPGTTTIQSLKIQEYIEWNQLPYNSASIGAGGCNAYC